MPSSPSPTRPDVTVADVEAARPAVEALARRTPMLSSRTISERAGGVVALKAENLQRTGSFKVRGVAAKLAALGEEGCRNGVVAASAGNHAQALAAAARQRGVHCEVFVPVGGGGLCAGVAIAVKSARPEVEVIGVQVAACAPYPESLRRGEPVPATTALTIADGIAVKRPGELTLRLLDRWADGVVVVGEDETAEAMVVLMERAKLVVEGAGAVGVAAILGGQVRAAASGTTVAILSGGNVDPGLLLSIARRHETLAGRRLVVLTRVPDRPGALAGLLTCVAEAGGNVVDVSHVREGFDLHVRETAVELVLETRGREHADRVLTAMREHGYPAQPLE